MINPNHKKHNGPTYGPIKKAPLVYKTSGGDIGGLVPSNGYFSSNVNFTTNINPLATKPEIDSGSAFILGSAFPTINSSSLPSDGHNPYEPIKIPFIHKFGGPHCNNIGFGTLNDSYVQEEFLRVKLPKDPNRNVFCPYTSATLTATTFPYGKTNQGEVFALGNRTGVSVFRYRFPLHVNKPSFDENLYTYAPPSVSAGHFAPLYSASIVNYFSAKRRSLEFQLDTNPGDWNTEYAGGGHCIAPGDYVEMFSVHPEISEGELENFNLPNDTFPFGTWDPLLGGANILQDTSNTNLHHICQGKTDGDDLSFFLRAQKGSIIKGIIELF